MGPMDLLKAPHMGVRELRNNLSAVVGGRRITVVTERGKPAEVLLPYKTVVALLTLLADFANKRMTALVGRGHRAIEAGSKGIPARTSLEKHLKP